ncbi:subtilisin-like protease TgSUB2, putative [Eimeria brunetti]|uniref:subtilisin n=1 Tax=Eimeria brunetti TaxID=51314 RepID=U6LIK1_9EIME|nr:subtilisin-like protease TgSUB2, putative [Eimeria brunetti]
MPSPIQLLSNRGGDIKILASSQFVDADHNTGPQGGATNTHVSGGSESLTVPTDAASAASSGSAGESGSSHPHSHGSRTQDISVHSFEASEEARSGRNSLEDENEGTRTSPSGGSSVWAWNPLETQGEPPEAESLENEGVPDNFVGIPFLDKAAEQQTSQTDDAAIATAGVSAVGYDSGVPSSSSTAPSGQEAAGEQHESSRRSSSGKYQKLLEDKVSERHTNSRSASDSSHTSSQASEEGSRESGTTLSPIAPHARDASAFDGLASESESGSIGQGSPKHNSDYNTTDGNSNRTTESRNNSSSSDGGSTTWEWALSKTRWPNYDIHDYYSGGDSIGPNARTRFISPSDPSGASGYSRYYPWEQLLPGLSRWASRGATEDDAQDSVVQKSECVVEVGGVKIDASYVDSSCTGPINVAYQSEQGQFMERRILLSNKTEKPLTVVMKTVNAKFRASPQLSTNTYYRNFSGPQSFLQGQEGSDTDSTTAAAAAAKTQDYINDMLKKMRRHRRKLPNSPLDLVVCFASPLDGNSEGERKGEQTEGEAVSFMQTSAGAARIVQTCEELLSVLEDRKGFSCEILEAVDVVILQFPPTADLSDTGEVQKVLSRLLLLEGKSILFFELSKPTSLQMVPVEEGLPDPPKGLTEKWAFVQAKEALKEQCSSGANAKSRLLSADGDDSPVAARLPQDPDLEKRLWGMYSTRCVHAWLHGEKGHKEVVVAVIDSGVANHSDLEENIWHNPFEIIDGLDDDNNGFVDDTQGWNFADNTNDIVDANGHGTHVAGTVGGVANDRDIVGCAPHVSIMKLQQFGSSGTGSIGNAVRALAYAILQNAHVINNSWGSTETTESLKLVIERAKYMRGGLGILFVNAAGNSSSNNDSEPFYPAVFDYEHTISVGAYDPDGNLAPFSNYGKKTVSVLAPGDRIYSTYLGDGFAFLSGTSMAAPHVSGVAALVFGVFKKANSDVTAAEVKDIMKASVQPLAAAQETTQWGGAVDAAASVLMARMGGMWMQVKCTDMIVDLEPGEDYASTLYLRGYAEGTYG